MADTKVVKGDPLMGTTIKLNTGAPYALHYSDVIEGGAIVVGNPDGMNLSPQKITRDGNILHALVDTYRDAAEVAKQKLEAAMINHPELKETLSNAEHVIEHDLKTPLRSPVIKLSTDKAVNI